MNLKEKFEELGYKLQHIFSNYYCIECLDKDECDDRIINIDFDKKKIIVHDLEDEGVNMTKEFLEILYEFLNEKGFFVDE